MAENDVSITMKSIKKITGYTMLFIGVFYLAGAHAIAPEKHLTVTDIALQEYQKCLQHMSVPDSLGKGKGRIVEYSSLEDTSPLLKRYFNWHFHDAYKDTDAAMGRTLTGVRKSLHHIFDEHINSLKEAISKHNINDVFVYTGRILHLTQDMTVPAHVAPIYHYKYKWFDKSDYFDEMPEWETARYSRPEKLCVANQTTMADLKSRLNLILDETANATRQRIREKINVDQNHRLYGRTWEAFWVIRNPDNDDSYADTKYGFAPYGDQKREGFEQLCKASGTDRALCMDFFRKSFDAAVTSSVKTLFLINNIILENGNLPSPESSESD